MSKKTEYTYNVASLAKEFKVDPTEIRKALRASGLEKPEQGWKWSTEKEMKEVRKSVESGLAGSEPKAKKPTSNVVAKGKKTETPEVKSEVKKKVVRKKSAGK